ncbi:CheR family methyltransferase [Geomonas sp.]|uniref:CheR family methyltransferase n=1 Tax=Geomonas sp. TaxID=2651584 RepID=UPI002B4814B2|nr:CheR family methyltransferase [Geomonas sp.]HJV35287.1 CheR family methyltransferase [Geomonas sp.]
MRLNILLISDFPSRAEQLHQLLTATGHAPFCLPEGTDPSRAIRHQKPDLVVVCVHPEKTAPLAVEHRQHTPEGTRFIPVIVISDRLQLERELLHVFEFIPWPLDVERLLEAVSAVAERGARVPVRLTLTESQYQDISRHILASTGLVFESRNRGALERGLNKRMAMLHLTDCADYLDYLRRHGESRHELQKLLQYLTVGETYFFRYPAHFQALSARLACLADTAQPIRIWSAGCSTGEEPYSIAISIMEALPDWRERDIRILATDINHQSLSKARKGVYTQWSLRTTTADCLKRYFRPAGEGFAIKEEVKSLVSFHHLNLSATCLGEWCEELQDLDAVFCRNVLIYFSPDAAQHMANSFAQRLKPAGQLFLGHAESLFQRGPLLELSRHRDSFFYVRREDAPDPASATTPASPSSEPEASPTPSRPPVELPTVCAAQLAAARFVAPADAPEPAPAATSADAAVTGPQGSELPAASFTEQLETARRLFDAERLDEAFDLLQAVLRDFPSEPRALILKGFILQAQGRLDEALNTCYQVIAINDLLPEAYFLKGVVLDACGLLAEAADEYRKALLLDHDFVMPRYHMGRLHLKLGRVQEAAREIRNSIRILARLAEDTLIPYSGGLSTTGCLEQLQEALASRGMTGIHRMGLKT